MEDLLLGLLEDTACEAVKELGEEQCANPTRSTTARRPAHGTRKRAQNQPHLFASDEETVRAVYNKCKELTWPHLKNSTSKSYEEHFTTYLLPAIGDIKVRKLTRMEVARDNMGHAGNTGSITLDVYSKTWWEERVDAVTRVVEAVFTEPDKKEDKGNARQDSNLRRYRPGENWEPFWVPQAFGAD